MSRKKSPKACNDKPCSKGNRLPVVMLLEPGVRRIDENDLVMAVLERCNCTDAVNVAQATEIVQRLLDIQGEMFESDFVSVAGTLDHHRPGRVGHGHG